MKNVKLSPAEQITAEMFSVPEEVFPTLVKNTPFYKRALDEVENGELKEMFGENLWEAVEKGEGEYIAHVEDKDPSQRLILLGHKARMGKDTFADFIKDILKEKNISVTDLSFAGPMKSIVANAMSVNPETLNDMKNESDYFRSVLQHFGSGKMKEFFGQSVWSNTTKKAIEKINTDVVIMTDFRFPAEALQGALTVKIVRPGKENAVKAHISEEALNDFDFDVTIMNEGTLEELKEKAEVFVEKEIVPFIKKDIPSLLAGKENNKKNKNENEIDQSDQANIKKPI